MAIKSKIARKLLRQYEEQCYQAEMTIVLKALYDEFCKWQAGEVSNDEMKDKIHHFHSGPSRSIYVKYQNGPPEMIVAHAIVSKKLDKQTVPQELLNALSREIAFYEECE